jgi:hypothetical protein
MEFKGVWNAATNTPTLANGTGNAGDVWLCNVAGTVDFGAGPIAFAVGDYAVYTGTVWARSSGATGTVTSVGVSRDGNALAITGSPVTSSGTINLGFSGDNTQYINGAGNLTTFPTLITSIGLTMPAAFGVSNSPLTANGTIGVTALGYPSQYIRGDGTLADFPTSGGGGSSVSYYLNGGTSQGTIGGTTYYEMSKTADTGTGVDFNKTGDGFIVAFLTDAGDPALLQIPAGNWNYEIYASMSSNGGTPQMYAELYVYNGTTFTLISTSSNEILYDGVNLNLYTFAMAVPETVLTVTDRLAIKLYATNSGGKTTTIHTQDSHLCQIITTFSTGLTALNGLTAQVQYFGTGTSGSDFNIVSSVDTHTFNLPTASATKRGALSSADWSTFNGKQDYITAGTTLEYWRGDKTWQTLNTSVVPELTNLYFTNARARTSISLTTTGSTGASTYDNSTGVLNIPNYVDQYVGTVTSVGLSAPTGFSVSGSPVTSSGTLALTFASGYSLPTNVKQSNWDDAYTWVAAFPTQTGNTGKFLTTDGSSLSWAANPLGTVTSVDMSVPIGLTVSGNPITTSGTLAVTLTAGYSIPTTASQTNWDTAYTNRITSATGPLSITTNVISISQSSGSTNGYLSNTDWTIFNNKQSTLTFTGPLVNTSGTVSISQSSGSTNGYLSSTDWSTFNNKQATISLTTTGTSGAATLVSNVLNIPQYQTALTNPVTGTGVSGYIAFWDSTSSITGESNLYWDATNNRLGIGISTPRLSLDVEGGIYTKYVASTLLSKASGFFAQSGSNIQTAFGFIIDDGFCFQGSYDGNNDMLSVRAATIDGTLGVLVASINTAGVGYFASNLTATNYIANIGNNSRVFTTTTATTGYQYGDMNNTSGRIVWGIEGSTAGTIGTGTLAYAAIVQSAVPTSVLQLGVNGIIKATFTSTAIGFGTNTPYGSSFTIQYAEGVRNRNATNTQYRSDWVVSSTGGTLFNSYDDSNSVYKPIEINGSPLYLNSISGSGNVLIGTYTDNGAKLQVIGSTQLLGSLTSLDSAATFSAKFGAGSSSPVWVALGTVGGIPTINGYNNGFSATANLALQPNGGAVLIGTSSSSWGTNLVVYGNQLTITGGGYDGTFADYLYFGGNSENTTYRNKISNSISSTTSNQRMKFSIANGATTWVDVLTLYGTGAALFSSTVQATRFSIGGDPYVNVGFTYKGTINGNNDTWGAYQGVLIHAPSANNSLAVGYQAAGVITKGGFTGLSYRGFQVDGLSASGTGTIDTTYGIYIASQSIGTNNYSAYFAQTVLIGTTTQLTGGGTLQVNGNVNINGLFQINGVTIGGGGGSGVTGSGTTNYITKWTGSSTLSNSVLYESGANIAIGSTVMIAKFNIYGAGGGSGSNNNLMLTTGNNSDYFGNNQIIFAYNASEGLYAHAIKSRHNSAGYAGNALDFYTWKYGDATTTIAGKYVMTLLGNGCVGIGETNPALSVGGEYGGLVIKNSMYLQLRLSSSTSESAGMEFKPNVGNSYEIQANSSSKFFVYDRTNSQYRFLIAGNGNVSIGSANDEGYKLYVNGNLYVTGSAVYVGGVSYSGIQTFNNLVYLNSTTYVASGQGITWKGSSGTTYDFSISNSGTVPYILSSVEIDLNAPIGQRYGYAYTFKGNGSSAYNVNLLNSGISADELTMLGGLKLSTTTASFIPPKMTTTQKNALASTGARAVGSIVYDTTSNLLQCWNGSSWNNLW